MFWRGSSEAPERREAVRAFVRDRLGLALEFATLGAYELGDSERVPGAKSVPAPERGGDNPLAGSEDGATAGRSPDYTENPDGAFSEAVSPKRTCGCSRDEGTASPVRPHARSSGKEVFCGTAARTGECSASAHRDRLRLSGTGGRPLRRRRGGDIVAAEQPCVWTGG